MADAALIDKNFSKRLDRAYDYFDSDRLEDCLLQAREILDDSACPRYHRMKTLILLGGVLGDWYEAKKCHRRRSIVEGYAMLAS
ncbi:hypothetical protein BU25DRAFT_414477 [Macroventuria anomochaeta]|uniref:Uncharacterized protein n=1 Tax=Macroventuria anomochaeta TaxID=301207 RepID=A0ACB6RQQ0_9PLEO|nr:uncharacterized protein BU25DRAFT_414477 [Macroventuria anomochaeta]KAF2623474.1 hypothetical protein BU25DRAFT_414477 [Macroventuria anomochaeta]